MRLSHFLPTPPRRTSFARWSRILAALCGLMLLAGCDFNFWRMDGHQSTIAVEGPVARTQLHVFYVTVWVTTVIFIIVGGVLAYATLKFRARSDADEHAEPPEQGHGNPMVELGLIGASVLALVIIAVPTLKAIWSTYDVPEERKGEAYEITATGYQWWFKFEYPAEQATVSGDMKMPLVTANELVIPAGRPIRIHLRTVDVIHSFWVPKLAGKVDMIPNRANHLWLQADNPGYYWGQCAEYCGDSHAVMRFRVIALGPREYNEWLDKQLQPAASTVPAAAANAPLPASNFAALPNFKVNETGITDKFDNGRALESWREKQGPEANLSNDLVAAGHRLFAQKTCSQCHTVRGHSFEGAAFGGVSAPDLTHVGARTSLAGGLIENNRTQLQRWIHNPLAVKPGNKMWMDGYVKNKIQLTANEEAALVSYLESLK